MKKILVIDDDKGLCRTLEIHLQRLGYFVRSALSVGEALQLMMTNFRPDLLLLDINLPDGNGLCAAPKFEDIAPEAIIIIMTAETDNRAAVEAMRNGAFDYLRKPFDMDDLYSSIGKALQASSREEQTIAGQVDESIIELIGSHPSIIDVHKKIGLLSRNRVNVLIQGESGTGKELAARILHDACTPDKPFVAINCSAVVSTLLESEFFGHEKGSFTGADTKKIGQFEFAGAGMIFLDEIGDMPLDMQAKLLRVLQEEEFIRVGGLQTIPLRARIVGATHHDLSQLTEQGRFRKDLYYRMTVSTLVLPPLQERADDIPRMVEYLLGKICHKLRCRIKTVDKKAMARLASYSWPGNVRELENTLTRSVAFSRGSVISQDELLFDIHTGWWKEAADSSPVLLTEAEKQHINKILLVNNWNITKTSKMLGISPTTLRKKISDYHIQPVDVFK